MTVNKAEVRGEVEDRAMLWLEEHGGSDAILEHFEDQIEPA